MLKRGTMVRHTIIKEMIGIIITSPSVPVVEGGHCQVYWQLTPKIVGLTKQNNKRWESRLNLKPYGIIKEEDLQEG